MRNWIWLSTALLTLALLAGPSIAKGGNGGGKPGGGGGGDPPTTAAPEIAYVEGGDLKIADADGSNPTVVLADVVGDYLAWSPDGTKLAFYAPRDFTFRDVLQADGLYVVDLNAAVLTKLYDGLAITPTWSAPSDPAVPSKIVFRAGKGLWIVNPDGGQPQALTSSTERVESYPTFSPDGLELAARFNNVVSGPDGLSVTIAGLEIYSLTFNADGTVVPFTGELNNPDLSPDVRVVVATTNDAAKVVEGTTTLGDPMGVPFLWLEWSPNGQCFVYEQNHGTDNDHGDLWILDLADPTHPDQLTDTGDVREMDASWSPDGTALVFDRQTKSRKESGLFLYDLNTRQQQSLGLKSGRFPAWWRGP